MARGLLARGVKQGDFLTIALPNGIGFVEACYAAWKIGATPQPVSWRLPLERDEGDRRTGELADRRSATRRWISAGRSSSTADLLARSDDDSDLPDAIAPVVEGADLRRLDRAAEADRGGPARRGAGDGRRHRVAHQAGSTSC